MPVYHFNVRDGTDMPDVEGTDLPDLRSARVEAAKLAGRLLMDHPERFWEDPNWHVEVADARGTVPFRLDFMATDAAARAAS